LIEKGSNQIEPHRLVRRQRCAAFRADFAPSQHADEDLEERQGNRQADPAQTRDIEACGKVGEINFTERKVK